jgi:AcrR family transcriptional regulator
MRRGADSTLGTTNEMSITACQRVPQQGRGHRRVDCVLDAAAALIAEGGLGAVTMQAIGKRSGTSAGSLYHFFPDRNSVLTALAARHVRALRESMAAAQSIEPAELHRLSIEQRVEHFVEPLLAHIAEHPDFLAVTHPDASMYDSGPRDPDPGPRDPDLDRVVMEAAELLVTSCHPDIAPAQRLARATMLRAAVEGMLGYAVRAGGPSYPALVRELKRMLVQYLRDDCRD